MNAALNRVLGQAVAEGLLPDTTATVEEERPWPVVLLTAFGAWMAAVPLCGILALLFGSLLEVAPMTYLVGAGVLALSIAGLRSRSLSLFVEQLAIPGILVGGGLLAFSLFRDLPLGVAALGCVVITVATAAVVPMAWLRVLLGALAAALAGLALMATTDLNRMQSTAPAWWTLHGLLIVWLLAWIAQRHVTPRAAACIESVATGWGLAVLGSLAWLSGMTFLVGGATGLGGGAGLGVAIDGAATTGKAMPAVSAFLAAAALAGLAWRWPRLRRPTLAAVPLVVLPMAWFMPGLGGVLAIAAFCAASARWRQAACGALAAAWIIGAFYYQLQWTLAAKAQWMIVAGIVLGAGAWRLRRTRVGADDVTPPERPWRAPAVLVAVAIVATLLVANGAIWQKEDLIARGRVVLVPLAPVDPRSLMQGDFMRLNFALPEVDAALARGGEAPHVVMALDARGVASPVRVDLPGVPAAPLADHELRIVLTPKDGRWTLVTDAWFFREGEAERFATARFGEFRVTPDGRALLVGLRDAELNPMRP